METIKKHTRDIRALTNEILNEVADEQLAAISARARRVFDRLEQIDRASEVLHELLCSNPGAVSIELLRQELREEFDNRSM